MKQEETFFRDHKSCHDSRVVDGFLEILIPDGRKKDVFVIRASPQTAFRGKPHMVADKGIWVQWNVLDLRYTKLNLKVRHRLLFNSLDRDKILSELHTSPKAIISRRKLIAKSFAGDRCWNWIFLTPRKFCEEAKRKILLFSIKNFTVSP